MLLPHNVQILSLADQRDHCQLLSDCLLYSLVPGPLLFGTLKQFCLDLKLVDPACGSGPLSLLLNVQHPHEVVPANGGLIGVEVPVEEAVPLVFMQLQSYFVSAYLDSSLMYSYRS
jgi:hypothetical protein